VTAAAMVARLMPAPRELSDIETSAIELVSDC
jgi:hypothetical protein